MTAAGAKEEEKKIKLILMKIIIGIKSLSPSLARPKNIVQLSTFLSIPLDGK